MIVADASVLTAFLLGDSQVRAAFAEEGGARPYEPLHAPEVVEPEVLNALRRLSRTGRISGRRATEAVSDLARVRLVRYPHAPLRGRIWALRDNLSAYDAAYLALAEGLSGATLITLDAGLAARSRASLGAGRVRHIE